MDLINKYITYDEPIPYKELKIYPAIMKDYIYFHLYANCLVLDKNSVPDINVISMTYLEFLFYTKQNNEPYLFLLDQLLKMVIRINDNDDVPEIEYRYINNKAVFIINNIQYDSDDFDKIREFICLQNSIELPDENIQKEVRDKFQETENLKMKQNTNKVCSLEDQMVCVLISTNLSFDSIYKLTIRKFSKVLERIDHKLHYEIYKTAELSGMVTFKQGVEHWMIDLTKQDKYKEVKVGLEEIKQKIS